MNEQSAFQRVATLASLTAAEWLSIEPQLPINQEGIYLLLDLIGRSARTPTVLFCFDDIVILRHDGHLSMSMKMMHTRQSGERIRGKNEVVDPSANLTCEVVRSIFVTLEALVYKIVHIRLKAQSPSYTQRTESYEKRLTLLVETALMAQADRDLAIELYKTRNQFAHSLMSVENIKYLSEPLSNRWGANGISGQPEFARYFLPDAFRYSERLLELFKPIQAQQIDGSVFKAELLAAVALDDGRATP